jgi:hypothetical protein
LVLGFRASEGGKGKGKKKGDKRKKREERTVLASPLLGSMLPRRDSPFFSLLSFLSLLLSFSLPRCRKPQNKVNFLDAVPTPKPCCALSP